MNYVLPVRLRALTRTCISVTGTTQFTHAQYSNDYNMNVAAYASRLYSRLFTLNLDAGGNGKDLAQRSVAGRQADNTRLSSFTMGRDPGHRTSAYMKGDVAEIIMYTCALTALERQQVDAYLSKSGFGRLRLRRSVAASAHP